MTAPTRARKVEDVDRDLNGFCHDRVRCLVQIDQYLAAIANLRAKYARCGDRVNELLDERHSLRPAAVCPPDAY